MKTEQINFWEQEFGKEYTDRNVVNPEDRIAEFKTMLGDLNLQSALEVGPNRGHNLNVIQQLFPEADVVGLEPNKYAIETARKLSNGFNLVHGNGLDNPFKDNFFDLVYTCGVLIHVPLEDLTKVIQEIYRTSKEYILCVEYFAEKETEIDYRGHSNKLWKRNFKKHYLDLFPNLEVVKEGHWPNAFGDSHWWIFKK
jgi:pseudaminic acid biosynthesis-associated methylase